MAILLGLAQVVKLADTPDLGSGTARCVGSSPILGKYGSSKGSLFYIYTNHLKNRHMARRQSPGIGSQVSLR